MSFYGNVGTPFLGSGLYGSSYLSSKHLKRAMKYGSYHAPVHSISAPAFYGSSYLGGATVIHAPVVQDSFVQAPVERVSAPAAVYSSQHFDGHYAPVEHTVMAAPMVHAPVYASRYYSKGGYRSSRSYFGNYIGGSVYSGAPVVHAPVEHVSAPAIYDSSYLSSKHLKRAMKYGSYYGAASVVSAPVDHIQWGHVAAPGPMVQQPLHTSCYYSKGGYQSSHHTDHYHLGEHLHGSEVYGAASVVSAPVDHIQWGHVDHYHLGEHHLHGSRNTAPAAAPVVQSVKKVIKVHLTYSSRDETIELPDDATVLTVKEYVSDSTGVEVGQLRVVARAGCKILRNDQFLSSNPRHLQLKIISPLLPPAPLPPRPVRTWSLLPSRRWEREHPHKQCPLCCRVTTIECVECEQQIELRPSEHFEQRQILDSCAIAEGECGCLLHQHCLRKWLLLRETCPMHPNRIWHTVEH